MLRGVGETVGEGPRVGVGKGTGVFVGGRGVGVLEGFMAGTAAGAGVALGSGVGDGFPAIARATATAGAAAIAGCSVGAGAETSLAPGWLVNTRTMSNVVTAEITTLTSITVIHCLVVRCDDIAIEYITIAADGSISRSLYIFHTSEHLCYT